MAQDTPPDNLRAARYADWLRASADWLWETDADGRLVELTASLTRHLDTPPQRLLGTRLSDLGRFDPEEGAAGARALASRQPFRDALFLMPVGNGSELPVRLSGVPVFDPANGSFQGHRGTAVHVEASGTDTDARELARTLERALLRANDLEWKVRQLQDLEGAHGDSLARLLHELRTPLNAVVGYSELALKRAESAESVGALIGDLKHIGEAARHMNRLIGDLYESQMPERAETPEPAESSGSEMPPGQTDVAEVVREATAMSDLSARRKGLTVEASAAQHSVTVQGDRKALTQIVVNLLANAVKFTPDGGKLGVDLRDGPTAEHPLRLAVWDTGPGIPEEEADRIFDHGYRLERDRVRDRAPGSGLGLAIARQLAEENGARLSVEGRPGYGTVFNLDLQRPPAA